MKVAVSGIAGRMGNAIGKMIVSQTDWEIVAGLEREDFPSQDVYLSELLNVQGLKGVVTSDINFIKEADCLIEFTFPEPTLKHLEFCVENRISMVIGTTALTSVDEEKIAQAAKKIAIVYAPNMSVGVNVLFYISKLMAQVMPESYEIEMVEAHHRFKKDAPSGTAKKFKEIIDNERKTDIPVHAIRAGDIVGEHSIIFAGNQEKIEISHIAQSRELFVTGSLKAAQWVVSEDPGLYGMSDVLGLKE